MPTLRAVVAAQAVAPMREMRRLAIEKMRDQGTFDARRVRCVGTRPMPGVPGVEFRTFDVEAEPIAV